MNVFRYSKLQFTFVCCCLIYLLSACSLNPFATTQAATPQAAATAIPASTPSPTTVPMPPTQTDCPATGTARAMVTAPLVLGSHPTVVYTVNQIDLHNNNPLMGMLKRYDVVTGNKTVIASIPDMSIYNAQVSTDGQWVLFTSFSKQLSMIQQSPTREVRLQAVRMDGQGLQTLYCATTFFFDFANVRWSPNQQLIAISRSTLDNATPNPNEVDAVQLLHTATGQLQNIYTSTFSVRSTIRFDFWADNTHIVLQGVNEDGGQGISLLDITKGVNQHNSDLTTILNSHFRSLASDGTKLYVGDNGCDQVGCSPPSTILAIPATGGVSQTLWHTTQYAVLETCPFNDHQLLVDIQNVRPSGPIDTSHNGIWILNSDGTLAQRLTSGRSVAVSNCASLWSHGSRDGSLYALLTGSNGASQLVFGKASGGAPTSFASYGAGLSGDIAGWTTF
ncbi:MAG TPA: hypothetical protein VFB60_15520 [Ktedonobacteraceae bacterium]|nr:hypothetical protein [Ktedonobacteraceae bacterium]